MLCAVCNEEVSDGRELVIDHRPVCRPCAAAPHADLALSTEASQWE
jgi:formylmethanofuran dehydrogenase subunit E